VEHDLLADLEPDEFARLSAELGILEVAPGDLVVRNGDPAAELFLVTRGRLSVMAPGTGPRGRRLSTVSAGMTFGELGYVDRGVRTADVYADTDVECRTLPYALLDRLAATEPRLQGKLLHGLARVVVTTLHLANAEVAHLTG
jgi:glutaminase